MGLQLIGACAWTLHVLGLVSGRRTQKGAMGSVQGQVMSKEAAMTPHSFAFCCPATLPPPWSALVCPGQVADPGSVTPRTLYGVCCYVRELVHRPPSMAREASAAAAACLMRWCAWVSLT